MAMLVGLSNECVTDQLLHTMTPGRDKLIVLPHPQLTEAIHQLGI